MKRTTAAIMSVLIALLVICSSAIMPAMTVAAAPVTTGGWLSDLDGNLVTDAGGYYVIYIMPEMVVNNRVTLNLNRYAALFLKSFKNVSNADASYKLRIVNNSGKKLNYLDYSFTTENILPRTNNLFTAANGMLKDFPDLGRTFGSAYTAMHPTITTPNTFTDLCLDVKCFDQKNINMMISPLRCVNDALKAFYNADKSTDITLPQMMNRDQNLIQAGYTGYADYLRKYYNVASLYDLPLETAYNVLGTTRGAQTGITCWADNTIAGKPVPASGVSLLTNDFKIWGILYTNADAADRSAYPYMPHYHMMETDSEVIQFAYDFLYAQGLRFSFDQSTKPFDMTDSEQGRGGDFAIKAYVNKTPGANAHVNSVFGGLVLQQGESIALDHVTAGLYVPNAWNQYRLYDYGFSILFTTEEPPVTTTQPGDTTASTNQSGDTTDITKPGKLPDTADRMPVFLISLVAVFLLTALAVQLILYKRKKK